MTTSDGHVKWVCRDHCRASYQEKHAQKLRDVVKLSQGEFDEQLGKIAITLTSSFAATELYNAVSKATGVLYLDVKLCWNQEYSDFVKLKSMVLKSNIRSIAVNLYCMSGPRIDIKLSTNRRYDPILEVMRLPSILSFGIDGVPKDFFKRSSAWPKNDTFSNPRQLEIGGLDSDADIVKLKLLVDQAPNLSTVSLEASIDFFERFVSWPRNTDFSNLRHLEIGAVDADEHMVKFKLLDDQSKDLSSLSLQAPGGVFERCTPWPKNADFSNLGRLKIDLVDSDEDIINLRLLVTLAPNIFTLSLETSPRRLPAVFSSIAE